MRRSLKKCGLCPHNCGVDRLAGQVGRCGIADSAMLSVSMCHLGEEPPLVKGSGSGTIFLSGCVARCCFCQNYQISLLRKGSRVSARSLSDLFLSLQSDGCSNINWVTPTPHLPFLLEALAIAVDEGLSLPLVFNSNGYINLEILSMLEKVVDIYLPDMKYGEEIWAIEYSGLPDYPEINASVVHEMYRQVGILKVDSSGAAISGLLVRHLVLPENRAGTAKVIKTIADIDPDISFSLMAQYRPCYQAHGHPILGRSIYFEEFEAAKELLESYGLTNCYIQSLESLELQDGYFPNFERDKKQIFAQE